MLDSLRQYRFILGSVGDGNLIDGTNDFEIAITWLKRFSIKMSIFDLERGVEYWFDSGKLHSVRIECFTI